MNKQRYEIEMEREIYHQMLDIIANGDIVEDIEDAAARKRILHVKTILRRMLDANAFHESGLDHLSVGDEQ